jgi:competence protein ComEC
METTSIYFRPAIPLLLAMISGIAAGVWFPGYGIWMVIAASLCMAALIVLIRKKKTARVVPMMLLFALGNLSIQPWAAPGFPDHHIIHFTGSRFWTITGVVTESNAGRLHRQRCILHTQKLERSGKTINVKGRIRLTVSGDDPKLSKGDRIVFKGRIAPIRNFNNPGGFDYRRYMAFKNVWGSAYVQGDKLIRIEKKTEKGFGAVLANARGRISHLIDRLGEHEQTGVLKALIVGDRTGISVELKKAFNRVGAGHLLAISGLHVGIIAAVSFFIFKWILSHIGFFLTHAWTKKGAVLLSAVPVIIYGLLSGMSPSTQRAVIMVMVFLAAFLFEREHDLINAVAIAALLILIMNPPSIFSISFQLSFAAVLAIIYGISKIPPTWPANQNQTGQQKWKNFIIKLYYFFMTSFFAVAGTLPIVMYYFNQVSLVGLPANIIFIPLIGFVVVPLGILAVFVSLFTTSGALVLLKAASAVLEPVIKIITTMSGWSFAAVKTVTPNPLEIVCFYVLFWALLNIQSTQTDTSLDENTPQYRRNKQSIHKPAVIVALLTIFIFSADAGYGMYRRYWHDDLRVTMIDVGHGNAALLELPHGKTMLIDGGGFSDNRLFDVGESIIAPLLWRKKIRTVDTLVLSHANSDHLNGLIFIADHFHVKQVWLNHEPADTFGYRLFMDILKKNHIQMPVYPEIAGIHDINGVRFNIVSPPVDFLERSRRESWRNLDNDSLVVKVSFGRISFLFPGDIKAPAEYHLVSTVGDRLKSTVLLSPHHGSNTSSTQSFLEKVNPEIIVISSRYNSRFGFPHPSVLKRYQDMGCRVLETAQNGAVSMRTDGRALEVVMTVIDN